MLLPLDSESEIDCVEAEVLYDSDLDEEYVPSRQDMIESSDKTKAAGRKRKRPRRLPPTISPDNIATPSTGLATSSPGRRGYSVPLAVGQVPHKQLLNAPHLRSVFTCLSTAIVDLIVDFTNKKIEVATKYKRKTGSVQHTTAAEIRGLLGALIFSGYRKDTHLNTSELWCPEVGALFYKAGMGGKAGTTTRHGLTLGHMFTKELTSRYQNTNRNVTTDNWFTSVPLIQYLLTNGLTLVGTVRANKPEIPPAMREKKDRRPGSSAFLFTDDMTLVSCVYQELKSIEDFQYNPRHSVYEWIEQFKSGRTSVEDEKRDGRLATATTDAESTLCRKSDPHSFLGFTRANSGTLPGNRVNSKHPDLAPSDYHLFGPLKDALRGRRFATDQQRSITRLCMKHLANWPRSRCPHLRLPATLCSLPDTYCQFAPPSQITCRPSKEFLKEHEPLTKTSGRLKSEHKPTRCRYRCLTARLRRLRWLCLLPPVSPRCPSCRFQSRSSS
ncbi:hypothetical protein O3P69_019020 [Scylla paramamosain]|uniref:PiggyBac transposable element-derived protein domain-containing protein n=1 Tax=Scylla paramamosain TaxID=85552 RepID=A0AAW0T9G1_SCYPA